jgi:RHH-type proline utilization regulon transcriptional repressor/proline dehydrogenase/delta 1-pyrroline-5-carboxylate dehydrogenase
VQPFGGEGLSGTGPKAGGPLYILRLLASRPDMLASDGADSQSGEGADADMPAGRKLALDGEPLPLAGPTGESNLYYLKPRGTVLCIAASAEGARAQYDACVRTGNHAALLDNATGKAFIQTLEAAKRNAVRLVQPSEIETGSYDAVLFEGDSDALRDINVRVAARPGPIVAVQGRSTEELKGGAAYRLEPLLREVSMSINTAAAGGNASLMMVG